MRVLAIHPGPHFSVADVHNGVVGGLRQLGCEVASFNLDDRLDFYVSAMIEKQGEIRKAFEYEAAVRMAANGLKSACYEFWPDVVLVTSGFFVPPEIYDLIRSRRHHVALWLTESPYEDDRQLPQAGYADTVIVNDPTNIDQFREVNPRTYYIPHGYDPAIHHPFGLKAKLRSDFAFVGTGYQSRIDFLEQIDWTGIDALLAGNWRNLDEDSPLRRFVGHNPAECIDNSDTADVYRATKVAANLYRKEAASDDLIDGWAMGPREVELAACETFYLREPRGEGDELLWMLPMFKDADEFGDLVRWWTRPEQDDARRNTAKLAREAVAERTFKNHAAELLRLISG